MLSVDKSVHHVLLNALHDQTDDQIYDQGHLNAPAVQAAFAFPQP